MKKVIKKKVSKVTASEPTDTVVSETVSSTLDVIKKNLIDKLELDTGRGDLNQMVVKINEIVDKLNGTI